MYNGFTSKKSETAQRLNALWKKKFERTPERKSSNVYASQSLLRSAKWVNQYANSKLAETLQKGCSSLCNASNHQFRDYTTDGSIYLRRYFSLSVISKVHS